MENQNLLKEKAQQDEVLEKQRVVQEERARIDAQSEIMNRTAVTYRDYAETTEFDGKYGIV